LVADDFVLAATGGVVWRADQATGETKGESEIGEPLGSGALVLRNRLLIAGSDGTIYVTDTPGGAN
jgi:hypothetical protein